MLLRLGRGFVFGGISFFALLGFVSVPLGDKTGWGHLQAIAATPAATHAVDEFTQSASEYRHRVFGWLTSRLHPSDDTQAPAASVPSTSSDGSAPHKPPKHLPAGTPSPTPPSLTK